MRSPVKQFDSICSDRNELKWDGVCCPISSITSSYKLLLAAIQPFVEAAKYIPEGTSPNDDISCIPRSCFCVGDFYSLVKALKND